MNSISHEIHWYETDQGVSDPPSSEQLVDVGNGDAVLAFTHRYLQAHLRPVSDDEVHNVRATIGRYKGPQVVRCATLESFLAGLLRVERA